MKKKRNERQKAIGQASYAKAQARKALDIAENEEGRKANDAYRARGENTPYRQRQLDKLSAKKAKTSQAD